MPITPERIKKFVQDATKVRESWLTVADKSWLEIEKKHKNRRLWSTTPNSVRKKARYQAWWSIFKIRQPLILSRIGIPIGRDTTQDGNDKVGQVAAILKERLATNLVKDFDFFDFLCCCRDDFLATNAGFARAYYEAKDVKEKVKLRITEVPADDGVSEPTYIDENGEEVDPESLQTDDLGLYIETDQVVDVTDERVYLEHVLYKNMYVDPTIRRWDWKRVKQIAFEEKYSEAEFKKIFGAQALSNLPKSNEDNVSKDRKRDLIKVYEYWDLYEKECAWIADEGQELIYPKDYIPPEEDETTNGIYNLERFYPMPTPMMWNQSTYEFWPTPEYYQVVDIIEDIHTIFSRIFQLTRALRIRILFDDNVEGLKEALNEAAEGDAIGVTNLGQSLVNSGGTLEGVVQYIPIEKIIQSMDELYKSFEQRLNVLYKMTGTSDLLQGLITDPTQRTFGERQMTEKYALNQLAEPQRKMQEYVKDCYELLCEMAIKNFKDETLDKYLMPETLTQDELESYEPAKELLKNNNKRFRIDLETDSTIALNEEFDKQVRLELVQTLTASLEKTSQIAQQSPALIVPELHALKYLIQGFRQGKLFQTEVTQAIDKVLEMAQQPQPAPFNKDEVNAQLKQQELKLKEAEIQANLQLEQAKIQSSQQVEMLKLQQDERLAMIQAQFESVALNAKNTKDQVDAYIERMKMQSDAEKNSVDAQLVYNKLQSDIALAQEDVALKRDELALKMQGLADQSQLAQMAKFLEMRMHEQEMQLAQTQQALEAQKVALDEREKFATEARLQSEHQLEQLRLALQTKNEQEKHQAEMAQQMMPQISITPPKPKKVRKKIKIIRDESGVIRGGELETETESDAENPLENLAEGGIEE